MVLGQIALSREPCRRFGSGDYENYRIHLHAPLLHAHAGVMLGRIKGAWLMSDFKEASNKP